jgi:hypothetical protein
MTVSWRMCSGQQWRPARPDRPTPRATHRSEGPHTHETRCARWRLDGAWRDPKPTLPEWPRALRCWLPRRCSGRYHHATEYPTGWPWATPGLAAPSWWPPGYCRADRWGTSALPWPTQSDRAARPVRPAPSASPGDAVFARRQLAPMGQGRRWSEMPWRCHRRGQPARTGGTSG